MSRSSKAKSETIVRLGIENLLRCLDDASPASLGISSQADLSALGITMSNDGVGLSAEWRDAESGEGFLAFESVQNGRLLRFETILDESRIARQEPDYLETGAESLDAIVGADAAQPEGGTLPSFDAAETMALEQSMRMVEEQQG